MTSTALPLIISEGGVQHHIEEDSYEESFSERGCLTLLCFGRFGFGPQRREQITAVDELLLHGARENWWGKRSNGTKDLLWESVQGLKARYRNYRGRRRKPAFGYDQESYDLNFDGGGGIL